MVDTKLRKGSMLSGFFVPEQSTRIICTRPTPKYMYTIIWVSTYGWITLSRGPHKGGYTKMSSKLFTLVHLVYFAKSAQSFRNLFHKLQQDTNFVCICPFVHSFIDCYFIFFFPKKKKTRSKSQSWTTCMGWPTWWTRPTSQTRATPGWPWARWSRGRRSPRAWTSGRPPRPSSSRSSTSTRQSSACYSLPCPVHSR